MASNNVLAKMAVLINANAVQFRQELQKSSKGLEKFASDLKGTFATIGIGLGLNEAARGLGNVINLVGEFEQTMSEVKAITGATGREFEALSNDALRLGAATKFTSTQVGQLQVAYGRLGFTTKEILRATEATLDLAAATGEDLAKSADVAGSTVRGFGLQASETQRVVDVMAKSFNETALGLDNFTEAMKYVAPIAQAAGASVEETTALLGVLADAGIRGSTAGTSLRKIFTDLAKDGRPLRERLAELSAKGITLTDAFDEVGRTAQTSLLILSKNTSKVDQLTASFSNVAGEAARVARIMQNNLVGDVEKLSSAWEGLILKVTSSNVFRSMVQDLTGILNAVQGGEITDELKSIARVIGEGGDAITRNNKNFDALIEKLTELRKETGKPIDISYIQELSEQFKLSDAEANRFYQIIVDVNKQLSFQEKTLADFKRSSPAQTYEDLAEAVERYKDGIYNSILQTQVSIATKQKEIDLYSRGGKETNSITEGLAAEVQALQGSIQTYRRKILILNEYVDANKTVGKAVDDNTQRQKTYANTLAGFQDRLKDLTEAYQNINLNDTKRLTAAAAEIASLNERIKLVRSLVDLYSKPLSINFLDSSVGRRQSNITKSALTDEAGKAIQTDLLAISPDVQKRFEEGLQNLRETTDNNLNKIKGAWIDLDGLIGSSVSNIAESLGKALAGQEDFGQGLLKAIIGFAKQFGEVLIATGTAALAAKVLAKSPYTAIIAGAALVAAASAAEAGLSKSQANYNSGSAAGVTSSVSDTTRTSASNSIQDQRITGDIIIRGQDLFVVLTNYQNNSRQTRVNNG